MKKLQVYLFVFLLSFNVFSQSNWELKGGPNYTYFVDAINSSPKIGFTLGLSRKFNLYKKLSLSAEADFTLKGAILEKRKIEPYAGNLEKQNAYSWDIHGSIGFFEIPVFIDYSFPVNNRINFSILIGPTYSIPLIDFSKFKKIEFIEEYDPNNPSNTVYDYGYLQESGFGNNTSTFLLNFGFDISYDTYFFEFRYVLDKRDVYHFSNLSAVHKRMNSFQILFGKIL